MVIWHYLFWQEKDKISAVLNKGNSFEILKLEGYPAVCYTEDYWEKWQEYAGFLKEDFIDFCFVFDKECPQITEYLKERQCSDNECIWDKYSIQKVADMMGITNPTQIYNKDGCKIAKTGSFRGVSESEMKHLIAVYRNSEDVIREQELKESEITPFIADMLTKLRAYDNL